MLEITDSFYGILFAIVVNSAYSKPCKFIPPCTCSTDDYNLDLKPLMMARNNLEFKVSDKDYTYYLHPCNVSPPVCKSEQMTACQIPNSSPSLIYGIAALDGNQLDGDPETGNFSITNKFGTLPDGRTSIVYVVCGSEEATFLDIDLNPFKTYKFTLKTRYGCIPGKGLSVGSILVILFFVLFLIYLVGGVLFLKFVRKAEGIEMIPNIEFWKDLPSLIKDGMVFTFRGCKAESTYEKI